MPTTGTWLHGDVSLQQKPMETVVCSKMQILSSWSEVRKVKFIPGGIQNQPNPHTAMYLPCTFISECTTFLFSH
jgi:hypothetical protein